MKLLATLALLLVAPSMMAQTFPIADVVAYHRIGDDSLIIRQGQTDFLPTSLISVDLPSMTVTIQDPQQSEFVSTWTDSTGVQHTVRTPYDRKKSGDMTRARNHHAVAVRALMSVWPPHHR